ncbi:hypothetical protein MP638_003766 [Amoeboaphelidium occidentale]|nr:hypothetical protein MP638_003766 [Amoeboaphelidium occidentale]
MIRNLFSWFSRRKFKGKDNYGNSYYEEVVPGRPRTRRTMTAAGYRGGPTNMSPAGYNSDKIPVQWRSWLSHTRLEPPTLEEIMADLQRQALVQQRAKQLDEQWRKRKEELLQTQPEYKKLNERVEAENKPKEVYFEESRKPPQPSKPIEPMSPPNRK